MKRCAYLTMREPGNFVTDYDVSFAAMAELGWRVDTVVWDDLSIDWDAYDAVYICTPWDYPDKTDLFLDVLEAIDRSAAHLINDLSLVHWNLRKTYLRDIEERGGLVVPSRWYDDFAEQAIAESFGRLGTSTVVIKPQVGANAVDTIVLREPASRELLDKLAGTFAGRPFFIQPFMQKVQDEGEYSLFFFDLEYSHAILKTPAAGDFRSQEEHGAEIRSVQAPERLLEAGEQIMRLIEPAPVYARADFVRDSGDCYLLMELELIEPSLYLRTDDGAAGRFAAAFHKRFEVLAGK
jgi:glutathione synthase/RimK-type ligase-like ATP-grasp enzyme